MTVPYILYNKVTGKILRTGVCPPSDLQLQVTSEDEEVKVGRANDVTQKIVEKKIVNRSADEIAARKAQLPPPPVSISAAEWQDIQDRLAALEDKVNNAK